MNTPHDKSGDEVEEDQMPTRVVAKIQWAILNQHNQEMFNMKTSVL